MSNTLFVDSKSTGRSGVRAVPSLAALVQHPEVWAEAHRVFRPGGTLLAGFNNPAIYIFDLHDLDTLEVCMDGQCAHPGESTDPLLFPQEAQARFLAPVDGTGDVVWDDAPAVTLLVRTEPGEILIPETVVELSLVYPNGEECGGGAFQGWFEATADGSISDVAAT